MENKILKALNLQITYELYSSYLYLQMSAWFDNKTLPGFANWMKIQAQEEISHAMILYNYVNERGDFVSLDNIQKPTENYSSALDVFEHVLQHEKEVTKSINNLMDLSISTKDYATKNRLEWFISEQVEEESNASEILGKLKLIGNNTGSLFVLDKELALRKFVIPQELNNK